MSHNITIPPEALEAGARAIREETYISNKETQKAAARAAFLAIVEAWPGMLTDTFVLERDNWGGTLRSETALILPLPQENSDE